MIDLYTWGTPNGYKISIMLEECGLPYTVHPVNLLEQEQKRPEYLSINPNGKIPAIRDNDSGVVMFESGTILLYLAEKTGRFMPSSPQGRWAAAQWVFWQVGGVGPMMGQAGFFTRRAPDNAQGVERFTRETARLLGVLESQLAQNEYVAGPDYSIADMALYPWIQVYPRVMVGAPTDAVAEWPNVKRWLDLVGSRPSVAKGLTIPHPHD
jgi:GSH-dependent disulfide-bond oxidoreductase